MQIETAVLRLCGQRAGGPTGLVDQSNARMRSPISPPPLRKLSSAASFLGEPLLAEDDSGI